MFKVVNGKKDGFIGLDKVYIGRSNSFYNLKSSVLANPYHIGKDGNRNEVIEKYRKWLWSNIQEKLSNKYNKVWNELVRIGELVLEGKDVKLVCYCKPFECHGDVIINCINWMISKGYIRKKVK
jgi:hypothetical protein